MCLSECFFFFFFCLDKYQSMLFHLYQSSKGCAVVHYLNKKKQKKIGSDS